MLTARSYAASFALGSIIARSRSLTVIRSPVWRPSFDSTGLDAYGGIVKTSPGSARSSVSSAVISFVVLAMARSSSASLA
jgi:hypothetical protein